MRLHQWRWACSQMNIYHLDGHGVTVVRRPLNHSLKTWITRYLGETEAKKYWSLDMPWVYMSDFSEMRFSHPDR